MVRWLDGHIDGYIYIYICVCCIVMQWRDTVRDIVMDIVGDIIARDISDGGINAINSFVGEKKKDNRIDRNR